MPIAVICPGCKTSFRVSEQYAGKQGPCPKCKAVITIPATAALQIETPEEYTSGGKTKMGAPNFKPIARTNRKFSGPVATIVGFSLVLFVVVAWLMGRAGLFAYSDPAEALFGKGELIAGLALVVISPVLAWAEYQALRDAELAPHQGVSVLIRSLICGLVYAALWAGYRIVPASFTEAVWSWVVILAPMLLIGSLVALACFDFDFGTAFVHCAFYIAFCMGLAWLGSRANVIPAAILGDRANAALLLDSARQWLLMV